MKRKTSRLGRGLIMKKKVYICAPLGGVIEGNVQKAVRYARFALKSGVAPVVPHFYALCLNDDIPKERELGRQAGMSLLWFCDEMWVFGDRITEGMQAEILFCYIKKGTACDGRKNTAGTRGYICIALDSEEVG